MSVIPNHMHTTTKTVCPVTLELAAMARANAKTLRSLGITELLADNSLGGFSGGDKCHGKGRWSSWFLKSRGEKHLQVWLNEFEWGKVA